MTEHNDSNDHGCSCSCHQGSKKHCLWGTVGIGLALFFSLIALATSLCAVHKGDRYDRDGWHGRPGPMMQWDRGQEGPGGPQFGQGNEGWQDQAPKAGRGNQNAQ